jgi:hypothetical protein
MFKLKVDPTFKAKVAIPVAGGEPKPITFIFKHRTRSALREWSSDPEVMKKEDVDYLMDMVTGWENVDEEFSRDALHTLLENYGGASFAIRDAYLAELTQQRLGN